MYWIPRKTARKNAWTLLLSLHLHASTSTDQIWEWWLPRPWAFRGCIWGNVGWKKTALPMIHTISWVLSLFQLNESWDIPGYWCTVKHASGKSLWIMSETAKNQDITTMNMQSNGFGSWHFACHLAKFSRISWTREGQKQCQTIMLQEDSFHIAYSC